TPPLGTGHVAAVLRALERTRPPPANGRWRLPVAVVVTKLDAMGLLRHFSQGAAAGGGDLEAPCRRPLEAWGLGEVLSSLDQHFPPVNCFASSPYGTGPFAPGAALLWLLSVSSEPEDAAHP